MSEIVIQIPEPVKSEVGEERACRCFCPLLFNEECVINARVNYGPGPRCPGPGDYALVPVGTLARMREALRECVNAINAQPILRCERERVIALAERGQKGEA